MADWTTSHHQTLLWILCAIWITTAKEDFPCPRGSLIHLTSLRCFWISAMKLSWFEARESCRETRGGDLASAESEEMLNFIHNSFSQKTTAWVWLCRLDEEILEKYEIKESDSSDEGLCLQLVINTSARWRRSLCAGKHNFICENQIAEFLPSKETYLVGLVYMTGVYTVNQIHSLPSTPDIGRNTVEMMLFPGLWFSHAGRVVSVELVVQPSAASYLARVQILRPYCSPNHHLVPPGCSSVLNAFSFCSAAPLCNTTGGCSVGTYWCHLLEDCVPTTSPCSTYSHAGGARHFASPPRFTALPPFYHSVADLPLEIQSNSEQQTLTILLPEQDINVYPDDVLALQHTLDSGTFLHCLTSDASANSPWRQSYLSVRGPEWGGWWEEGVASMPKDKSWVDGVVCDLRVLYVDTIDRETELEDVYDGTTPIEETTSNIRRLSESSKFQLQVIYPPPDEKKQIHVQINVPTLIVVRASFGDKARSAWSAPILQTGVPFHPSCPQEVIQSAADCQIPDSWFSSAFLTSASLELQTLSISAMDGDRFQSIDVKVLSHEAVTGLHVEPQCNRILTNISQILKAKVKSGSSIKFTWMMDDLKNSSHEGESHSVLLKRPAEYKLQVTAANPVSSQSHQILLTADEMTPLSIPHFLSVSDVAAVNVPHLFTIGVKVDVSLAVTFRWDFGDGSGDVIHKHSAPCQTAKGFEKRAKQVHVRDSVNHTYSISGKYDVRVDVSNQYERTDTLMKISVRRPLESLVVFSSSAKIIVNESFQLEASVKPSSFSVFYTWRFGDGSEAVQHTDRNISHRFESAGQHNVSVSASNGVTTLHASLVVSAVEKITGLAVAHGGPAEAGTPTDFRATLSSGTDLLWDFNFGDTFVKENLSVGFISHIYKTAGFYKVGVTAHNPVSRAHQFVSVEVYSLIISGVLPADCVLAQDNVQFTALVNGNISNLSFHWAFEDSPPVVVVGQAVIAHSFLNPGTFHVNLTVFSSVRSVSFSTSICVESSITSISVQTSSDAAAIGEEVCLTVSVSPEKTTGYQFRWRTTSLGESVVTETPRKCFVFREEGFKEVFIVVSNEVSNKTSKVNLTVQQPVSEISIWHDDPNKPLMVNTSVSFWVSNCTGSNVSVVWDFGDGSHLEWKKNVSHVFTTTGKFTVTASAFNAVSRNNASLNLDVLLCILDLSLHPNRPYAVVGEESVIIAVSRANSSSSYYWTVIGLTTPEQGSNQFRFTFYKPGVYQVTVKAKNSVSEKEATTLIEVFERIEDLHIDCRSLIHQKYVQTQEEMILKASVTKGSNITYSWLAKHLRTNQETRGNKELFYVTTKTPGMISINLTASNILGEVTVNVSYVAVERVTRVRIETKSNVVALGKAMNISVLVDTGSDLEYFWYVETKLTPVLTLVPFLVFTFTKAGQSLVMVSVQNVLSQSNDSKMFSIQEEIQKVEFLINEKKPPFFFNTSATLLFRAFADKGNELHWDWKVKSAKETIFTTTGSNFTYIFPHAETFQVFLNVSNEISCQMISHNVTTQEPIQGLWLNISKTSICTGEQVTFIPTLSEGSNVNFVIKFQNEDWIQSQDVSAGQLSVSNLPAGKHKVTIKAMNQVNRAETNSYIVVMESIQGLQLVNCCFPSLEALKRVQFKAKVQGGFQVNYTWTFHLEGSQMIQLHGQEVFFTPSRSGLLSLSVYASNGVCSQTRNETAGIEWPVRKVILVCHAQRIFVGYAVRFTAIANNGTSVRYLWDFGDASEELMTNSSVSYVYHRSGKHTIGIEAFNNVSRESTQLQVDVEELLCSKPQISMVQKQSIIFKSRQRFFEASVKTNCSAYKTSYKWEILRGSCTDHGNKVDLRNHVNTVSPILWLPKHTLDVGSYCLVFAVSLQETPLLVEVKTNISVAPSLLVPVIKGGSHRLWPSLGDLVLDGSESHDPDVESEVEDTLEYHWACSILNSTDHPYIMENIESMTQSVIKVKKELHAGDVYVFTLTVHKNGREPVSVNQTVTVTAAPVLPAAIKCRSCSVFSSVHHINPTNPLVLIGQCDQCDDQVEYKWSADDQSGMTVDLGDANTSTGFSSSNLVVLPGVLQAGRRYRFTLHVSQFGDGRWGRAGLMIQTNSPPHHGLCDLSPEADIHLLETAVTYNCSGWQDDENGTSQLIYTFQVALCQTISSACPLLILYRGTRSTFSTYVPVGSPGHQKNISVITVSLQVEDHRGARITALNRTLAVLNPENDKTLIPWLRNKIQTDLWALVQQGNPQQILPYLIALTSILNQMESRGTDQELADMKEIWENATRILTTLPVSTMDDVDQLSSALILSTAVSHELLSEKCQESVLNFVEKLIHVLKLKLNAADVPTVEMGEKILSVLGGTMAAVSGSNNYQSPDSGYREPLQAASKILLSALGRVEDLMSILMNSHVRGETPLLLSTKVIKAVGFFGDPTDLLCTDQTKHFNGLNIPHAQPSPAEDSNIPPGCPFLIPNSLAFYIKSQMSEVVQVLFSVDAVLDLNPLLRDADPPISTSLVSMKLKTPEGLSIPIQDLNPEQAIRVTLPNKYPTAAAAARENVKADEDGNESCLTVILSNDQPLNFAVKVLENLNKNAGLYISFNFSLAPGASPVRLGHVKTEVVAALLWVNASQDSFVREWPLTLSALSDSCEKTIFLSLLLDGRQKSLLVNLTSSLVGGGPVMVSVCVFSSLCQFYDGKERRWSSEGLRPLEGSTTRTAHCLTQHLTLFGASLFLHPGAVVLLSPPAGIERNMTAGILCTVLILLHLLVGLIAHKLDHLDSVRLSQVPLCGRPGRYHYRVLVKTGWRSGAGTTAHVGISLHGVNKSGSRHLQRDGAFQRSSLDQFEVETDENLGEIWKIRIWHDNTGLDPSWYVQHVVVWDSQTDHMFFFLLEDWLSVENPRSSTVEKEILASCPNELTQFRRVFTSQLIFGMSEHHLWLSLWERPLHSRFTRGQRVTCCVLTLHLYLALGALWYGAVGVKGQSDPVSAHLLVNMETVAVGMVVSLLVFPLQSFLCFLFSKTFHQVSSDVSVPPSPVCHSVEMDVYLSQSELSGFSFLQNSSGLMRYSPSSLLDSEALNSSLLDFWTASGLVPHADVVHKLDEEVSSSNASMHQLKRRKALTQLHPSSPVHPADLFSSSSPLNSSPDGESLHSDAKLVQTQDRRTTTRLSLSDEDLPMPIEAAEDAFDPFHSNSDSGRDSPKTTFSATHSISWSSWSEEKSLNGAETDETDPELNSGLYKLPSEWSVDSVASTFLPESSDGSARSASATRLGVARRLPGWLLPSWVLGGIYLLVAALLAACLTAVGLYGSFFSQTVLLMWLVSAFSAFFTSAVLLEPLKVCVLALICTVLRKPVDPEVEEQLALQVRVVGVGRDASGAVRPPCGYGLLQAKEEARKVRALKTLMRRCVSQMFFLLLVLMVNYQDMMEQKQGRLLLSTVRRQLHATGSPNLTSLRGWSDTEQWIVHTLVPHLHQNPNLQLVGLPRLQHTHGVGFLANNSGATLRLLADMKLRDKSLNTLSVDFTQHHRQLALFLCVSVQIKSIEGRGIASFLSIHPLLISSSSSGPDLHLAVTILLFVSALFILFGELWCVLRERAGYMYHWFQLFLGLWTLATAVLQLCFLSLASSCAKERRSNPDTFISFHSAARMAETSNQCAAVLLTLLLLKLLGTLRFVRRWVMIDRMLQRAWRELWAVAVLLLLQLLLCTYLGNALFSQSVEGFLSEQQSSISVLSILSGRTVFHKLCRVHPVLGPLYGLLLMGGSFWLLARLCGAVLIHKYRERAFEVSHSSCGPQDYEMVDFFLKRLKLWMGVTKAKEFRHRVKFEGVAVPPSRSSHDSFFSTFSSSFPSSYSSSYSSSVVSPGPTPSEISVRSKKRSISTPEDQLHMDKLDLIVNTLLSHFDQVNQLTDDIYKLEVQLEEAQVRRRKKWISDRTVKENKFERQRKSKEVEEEKKIVVRCRKVGLWCPGPRVSLPFLFSVSSSTTQAFDASPLAFPRLRNSSVSVQFKPHPTRGRMTSEAAAPTSGITGFYTSANVLGQFPRRRAWHSGSSHSADSAQRALQFSGAAPCRNGGENSVFTHLRPRSEEGIRGHISGGVPLKRRAWISEDIEGF